MGIINCPHCGKDMYEALLECPHCGGPIQENIDLEIDELCKEESKKEWKAIVISALITLPIFFFFWLGLDMKTLSVPVQILLGIFMFNSVYGIGWAIKKLKTTILWGFIVIPFIGWGLGLALVGYIGVIAGFIIGPRAAIRTILRKPLVSRAHIIKEYGYDI